MADPAEPVKRSATAWALRHALRVAAGTCVVALLLATILSGDAAERFATTAYLCAAFAALALVLLRYIPGAPARRNAVAGPPFPALLAYALGVAIVCSVVAALAAAPGAEMSALAAGLAVVGVAILARRGSLASVHAALVRGGTAAAPMRYAAAVAAALMVLAALVSGEAAQSIAALIYWLMILAAVLLAASLVARTPAGIAVRAVWARMAARLDAYGRALVFVRTAGFAAAAAAAAILCAGLLPGAYAEPLAVVTYAAAVCATFGVAMECRRLRS